MADLLLLEIQKAYSINLLFHNNENIVMNIFLSDISELAVVIIST